MDRSKQKIVKRRLGSAIEGVLVFGREGVQSRTASRLLKSLERVGNLVILFSIIEGRQDDGDCIAMCRWRLPALVALHPGPYVSLLNLAHRQCATELAK